MIVSSCLFTWGSVLAEVMALVVGYNALQALKCCCCPDRWVFPLRSGRDSTVLEGSSEETLSSCASVFFICFSCKGWTGACGSGTLWRVKCYEGKRQGSRVVRVVFPLRGETGQNKTNTLACAPSDTVSMMRCAGCRPSLNTSISRRIRFCFYLPKRHQANRVSWKMFCLPVVASLVTYTFVRVVLPLIFLAFLWRACAFNLYAVIRRSIDSS